MRLGEFDGFYRRLDCGEGMIGVSIAGVERLPEQMSSVSGGRAKSWADGRRDRVSGWRGCEKKTPPALNPAATKTFASFRPSRSSCARHLRFSLR